MIKAAFEILLGTYVAKRRQVVDARFSELSDTIDLIPALLPLPAVGQSPLLCATSLSLRVLGARSAQAKPASEPWVKVGACVRVGSGAPPGTCDDLTKAVRQCCHYTYGEYFFEFTGSFVLLWQLSGRSESDAT